MLALQRGPRRQPSPQQQLKLQSRHMQHMQMLPREAHAGAQPAERVLRGVDHMAARREGDQDGNSFHSA